MLAKNHPNFSKEQEHLEETLEWIEEEKEFLKEHEEILKTQLVEIRKTVNTLMDERLVAKQQLHKIAVRGVENLVKARDNPYFGRIDFQENRRDEIETIYIGKCGLHDKDEEMPIVVDWRAPIADVYYSGHSKDVSYRAPLGEIEGKMHLKRRYEIQEGELKQIFDDKTADDKIEDSLKGKGEFLTEALNKSTQGRLKEIVATIQDQQNKIIRSEMINPLVVQGVAGSGKTTIALHRMAYLIYNNRRNTEANYMVVAPNKLFLNYIQDILPDLGVKDVVQTTFEDWAIQQINMAIKVRQRDDQLNILMNATNSESRIISLASKIKGSLLFKKVIDNRIRQLERTLLPEEDLIIDDIQIFPYKKTQEVFLNSDVHLPIEQRIKKLSDYLKVRLKKEFKEIQENVEDIYRMKINELKDRTADIDAIRKDIIQLYDERDQIIQHIKNGLSKQVDQYMGKIQPLDMIEFYRALFIDREEMKKAFTKKIGEAELDKVCNHIMTPLIRGTFENEDLAPLSYIHIKLFGLEDKKKYAHIVVDEAQDLDEFKMSILRELSMNDSFTFVGDLSQGIYSYRGINSWSKTMERVFKNKKYNYYLLTTSYRSTVEIVNLANGVIKKCMGFDPVLAEPIFRHGDKPLVAKCQDEEDQLNHIQNKIKNLNYEEFGSVAIICKDLQNAERTYGALKDKIDNLHLITERTADFHGGIVVIPSYMSKGLEFDAVFIYDGDRNTYTLEEMDIKLLYIGITRALHKVWIYYQNDLSEVLKGLDNLYDIED